MRTKTSNECSVSAVMFVYNEANFIGEQLDSMLRQTMPLKSIIVVDDQSTDNTKAIVDSYIAHYPELIEYHYNPKKGKVNALSFGLNKVKTKYYFVCAGDDIISDFFVETNCSILEESDHLFVYNWYVPFYAPYDFINLPLQRPEIVTVTFRNLLNGNEVGGAIFANAVILKDLLPLNEQLPFEDWYISLKLASKYTNCIKNNVPTVLYRKHAQSDSANLHFTRERFKKLLERDIKLFRILEKDTFFRETERKQFRNKILYLENMLCYNPVNAIKIFFKPQFKIKDRLKSLVYPIVRGLKYKISNKAPESVNA